MATARTTRPRNTAPTASTARTRPAKSANGAAFSPSAQRAAIAPPRPAARPKARAKERRADARVVVPEISDRVLGVMLLTVLLFGGLVLRLFHLQVLRHAEFVRKADDIRQRAIQLPARRGVLLDRDGNLLVRNEPACDIALDPNVWYKKPNPNPRAEDSAEDRKRRAISGVQKILLDVDVEAVVARRGIVKSETGKYRTIDIALRVPVGVGERIRREKLPGVAVLRTARRVATDGDMAPHVIGYTGRDGEGRGGLEYVLDSSLAGLPGEVKGEFDNKNRPIPGGIRSERAPRHGRDVVLTLDAEIQHIAQEALLRGYTKAKAASATAIVLDPSTGEILALANYPSYNVNDRHAAPPIAQMNRAVTAPFEPGSTLKAVTIAAALEERKIAEDARFYCKGFQKIGRRVIHCHDGEVHKDESVTDVVRNSCNVATAVCAFDLGKKRLHEYLLLFGFGRKTESGLPGEEKGQLAAPERWSDIQTANIAFGQGVSVTALQMAAAYGVIANDGVWVRPHIVRGVREASGAVRFLQIDDERRVLSAPTARAMRRMLRTVVENGTGTKARLDGYTAGGKTGTAQIAERGGYGGKHLASFVGMAPLTRPRFVILVAVTDPKGEYYGGSVAGPVFKEIAERSLVARRVPRDRPNDPKKARPAPVTARD